MCRTRGFEGHPFLVEAAVSLGGRTVNPVRIMKLNSIGHFDHEDLLGYQCLSIRQSYSIVI